MGRFPLSGGAVLTTTATTSGDVARGALRLSGGAVVIDEVSTTAAAPDVTANGLPFDDEALRVYVVSTAQPAPPGVIYSGGLPYANCATQCDVLLVSTSAVANHVNGVPVSASGYVVVAP